MVRESSLSATSSRLCAVALATLAGSPSTRYVGGRFPLRHLLRLRRSSSGSSAPLGHAASSLVSATLAGAYFFVPPRDSVAVAEPPDDLIRLAAVRRDRVPSSRWSPSAIQRTRQRLRHAAEVGGPARAARCKPSASGCTSIIDEHSRRRVGSVGRARLEPAAHRLRQRLRREDGRLHAGGVDLDVRTSGCSWCSPRTASGRPRRGRDVRLRRARRERVPLDHQGRTHHLGAGALGGDQGRNRSRRSACAA